MKKTLRIVLPVLAVIIGVMVFATSCIDYDLVYAKGDIHTFGRTQNEEDVEWVIQEVSREENTILYLSQNTMTAEEYQNLIFTEREEAKILEWEETECDDGIHISMLIKIHLT